MKNKKVEQEAPLKRGVFFIMRNEDTFKEFKILCLRKNIKLGDVLNDLIEAYLKKN